MLTAAQIKKIQSKVGKKVDKEINDREEKKHREAVANLYEIKNEIKIIESSYPDRGKCVCSYENVFYVYEKKIDKVVEAEIPSSEINAFDLIKEYKNKKYFLMNKKTYEFNKKIVNFMTENYAHIKIALNSQKNTNTGAKERLSNMFLLGGIFEKFQKEFPESSMLDFKQCVDTFDKFIQDTL